QRPARLRAVGGLARRVLVGLEDAGVDDADIRAAGAREAAEAGRVPALGRVDVGVGGAARLPRVVEAVELAEARVVRRRRRREHVVGLGVLDGGVAVERRG